MGDEVVVSFFVNAVTLLNDLDVVTKNNGGIVLYDYCVQAIEISLEVITQMVKNSALTVLSFALGLYLKVVSTRNNVAIDRVDRSRLNWFKEQAINELKPIIDGSKILQYRRLNSNNINKIKTQIIPLSEIIHSKVLEEEQQKVNINFKEPYKLLRLNRNHASVQSSQNSQDSQNSQNSQSSQNSQNENSENSQCPACPPCLSLFDLLMKIYEWLKALFAWLKPLIKWILWLCRNIWTFLNFIFAWILWGLQNVFVLLCTVCVVLVFFFYSTDN